MTRTSSNLFVVDVETTGANPFLHDPLSVAVVPMDDRDEPFTAYVKTLDPKWSDFAAHNFESFKDTWIKHAQSPERVVAGLETYLTQRVGNGKATMVGHNVGFDMAFLRKLAWHSGKEDIAWLSHRSIDTHTLLFAAWQAGKLPEEALTSDGAFKYFEIEFKAGTRHSALSDALATRTLFLSLLKLLATGTGTAARRYSARNS